MLERNIPHDFIVRLGTHEWDYWVMQLNTSSCFSTNSLEVINITVLNWHISYYNVWHLIVDM